MNWILELIGRKRTNSGVGFHCVAYLVVKSSPIGVPLLKSLTAISFGVFGVFS